ncbi:hypothetical protein DFH09DRAFT_448555 [Mycena vulgaris]|nr:hypothetical protein DFH09DRAFT_448555 [Mycena vulgaris]
MSVLARPRAVCDRPPTVLHCDRYPHQRSLQCRLLSPVVAWGSPGLIPTSLFFLFFSPLFRARMGRWTVEEWQAAQAQQHYSVSGMDVDGLGKGDRVYTPADDDSDDFEDEYEDEDEGEWEWARAKPLPATPGVPPTPPPKTPTRAVPVIAHVAQASSQGSCIGSRVHKLLGAMRKHRTRGKRSKATTIAVPTEKPGRTEGYSDYRREPRIHRDVLLTPTRSLPRSPGAHRPREFLASPRTTVAKRVKSTPLKSNVTPASGADAYTYHAQGLEVFVSTQTTATASSPDARRPRVFFPRSSSLAATRHHNVLPPPPAPPPPQLEIVNHPRALPSLPMVPPHDIPLVPNKGTQRIRPLPVPVRSPP